MTKLIVALIIIFVLMMFGTILLIIDIDNHNKKK